MATSNPKELLTDLSPVIKVYNDGTVERLFVFPVIPPPPEDPTTGVATKDAAISPFISARLYLPTNPTNNLPIFLHFHGGGFCVGSALSASDHRYLSLLSAASAALIISVDYRLAPEHPLPAAYNDAWTALEWLCSHASADSEQTGFEKDEWISSYGDFSRVSSGDSSGGNIAHNIAMRAGSDSLPGSVKISGTILSPPYFWGSVPVGNEPKEDIEQSLPYRLWRFVFPSAAGGIDNPMTNPLAVGAPSLSGLGCSKMMVCLSEKDLLTGRGRVYAEAVKKSGWKGKVQVVEVEGEGHCFHNFSYPNSQGYQLDSSHGCFYFSMTFYSCLIFCVVLLFIACYVNFMGHRLARIVKDCLNSYV